MATRRDATSHRTCGVSEDRQLRLVPGPVALTKHTFEIVSGYSRERRHGREAIYERFMHQKSCNANDNPVYNFHFAMTHATSVFYGNLRRFSALIVKGKSSRGRRTYAYIKYVRPFDSRKLFDGNPTRAIVCDREENDPTIDRANRSIIERAT